MKVRLRIDGTDYTTRLFEQEFSIDEAEGKQVSVFPFVLDDPGLDLALSSLENKEVILDDPDNAATVRYFGGILMDIDEIPVAVGRRYNCLAQSWVVVLERTEVTKDYLVANFATDKLIIADAFTEAGITEFNTATYVLPGQAIQVIRFNHDTLRKVMDTITEINGFVWFIDHFKYLHHQGPGVSAAAFELSDSPDATASPPSYGYVGLIRTKDLSAIINKVVVRGGIAYTADLTIDEHEGNAVAVVIKVKQINSAPSDASRIEVWRNDGTDAVPVWTAKTVGLGNIDSLTDYDCLWYPLRGELEFAVAPANLDKAVRVRGRQSYPFLMEFDEPASYVLYGRWFIEVVNDEDIVTDDAAEDRANAILRERAFGQEKITLSMDHDGLKVGMLIRIVNSNLSIDAYYSVKKLVTRLIGAELASYDVTLTQPSRLYPDVIDMIAAGYRASMPMIPVRDERLHVFKRYTEADFAIAEGTPTITGTGTTYYASPTANDPIISGFWRAS